MSFLYKSDIKKYKRQINLQEMDRFFTSAAAALHDSKH